MTGTKEPVQMFLSTSEILGSVKLLGDIFNPLRTHTENWMDPNIQPTIVYSNQATIPGPSDRK